MASLQDQLLKAGLVDEKKAKKANKTKRKQAKVDRRNKDGAIDENKASAQQAIADKTAKDRELNRIRQEQADQKAIAAQIKQLIQMNKIDKEKGEIAFNFVHGKKIKKIYVSEKLQNQLSIGRLAIVSYTEKNQPIYEIVAPPVAQKIAQRDDSYIILLSEAESNDNSSKLDSENKNKNEEEDWYSDYEIPDDLMW